MDREGGVSPRPPTLPPVTPPEEWDTDFDANVGLVTRLSHKHDGRAGATRGSPLLARPHLSAGFTATLRNEGPVVGPGHSTTDVASLDKTVEAMVAGSVIGSAASKTTL